MYSGATGIGPRRILFAGFADPYPCSKATMHSAIEGTLEAVAQEREDGARSVHGQDPVSLMGWSAPVLPPHSEALQQEERT